MFALFCVFLFFLLLLLFSICVLFLLFLFLEIYPFRNCLSYIALWKLGKHSVYIQTKYMHTYYIQSTEYIHHGDPKLGFI